MCRPPTGKDSSSRIEIIRLIIDEEVSGFTDLHDHDLLSHQFEPDEQPGVNHFACAWSKDLITGDPLLCVSGTNAKIKVINVLTGECLRVSDARDCSIHIC